MASLRRPSLLNAWAMGRVVESAMARKAQDSGNGLPPIYDLNRRCTLVESSESRQETQPSDAECKTLIVSPHSRLSPHIALQRIEIPLPTLLERSTGSTLGVVLVMRANVSFRLQAYLTTAANGSLVEFGFLVYSIASATRFALEGPSVSCTNARDISIPADTPEEV